MKPGIIYRFIIGPKEAVTLYCDISDNDFLIDDSETEEIREMIPAGSPFNISFVDNEEDPMTCVKAQQLTLKFLATHNINFSTFASGSDRRFSVHAYIDSDTKTIFRGYLGLDDIEEAFMPHIATGSNEVTLIATCGLGGLGDIALSDFNGNAPLQENKIIEYLAWCLSKTGLSLQIDVASNIKLDGMTDDISIPNSNDEHLFSNTYIDPTSYEDDIGTTLNCLEVIKRILGEENTIFQYHGKWFIKRIDEVEGTRGLYITTFTSTGQFIENRGAIDFNKDIGKDSPYTIFFSDASSIIHNNRGLKSSTLTYRFETPSEIPRNKDFSQGVMIATLSPTSKSFVNNFWTLLRGVGTANTTPNCQSYIQRNYDTLGYEKERFAVLTSPSVSTSPLNFIHSERIYLSIRDKFIFSVDYAWGTDASSGSNYTQQIGAIRLFANDGTHYTLDDNGKWFLSDSNWTTNFKIFQETWVPDDIDETQFRTKTVEAEPCPKDGYIQIMLFALNQQATSIDNTEIHFNNIQFDYHAYINGGYEKYTGQQQKFVSKSNVVAKREKTVYVAEGLKRLFKGSLLRFLQYVEIFNGTVDFVAPNIFTVSGYRLDIFRRGQRLQFSGTTSNNTTGRVTDLNYILVGNKTAITIDGTLVNETHTASIKEMVVELATLFYNAAVFPGGPPDSTYLHPYSEIQAGDVWNQVRNDMRVFRAVCVGLDLASLDGDLLPNNAHLIHKWALQDVTNDTVNRSFQLLTASMDFRSGRWNGTLREVYNFVQLKDYFGREYKLITT